MSAARCRLICSPLPRTSSRIICARRAGIRCNRRPTKCCNYKLDGNPAASSVRPRAERRALESEAVARDLGAILDEWRDQGDFVRIKVLELLFVKAWANRDVAALLRIGEQQVANIRFAAVKKINERARAAGLPADVFPELQSS